MGSLDVRSEEHTSELQSRENLVCRLLLEKKKKNLNSRCCSTSSTQTSAHYSIISVLEPFTGIGSPRRSPKRSRVVFFFFNDTATTEIYTLSLHDALPI